MLGAIAGTADLAEVTDGHISPNKQVSAKRQRQLNMQTTVSHIPRVQKPGLRSTALAFLYPRPGQKPAQAKSQARLGPAFFGLAWPGFWLQARAGTSLHKIKAFNVN